MNPDVPELFSRQNKNDVITFCKLMGNDIALSPVPGT